MISLSMPLLFISEENKKKINVVAMAVTYNQEMP